MSTKASIILTKDNEHWYHETLDGTIEIEILKENIIGDIYDDGHSISITIKHDCDLWRELSGLHKIS